MSYNTTLTQHNAALTAANADHNANSASLQEVLDAVNALPDAGSGDSGSRVATCTVVGAEATLTGTVRYMTADGYAYATWEPGVGLVGVLCNSFLSFRIVDTGEGVVDGGTLLETNGKAYLVGIAGTPSGTVTIDIY